MDRRVAEVRAGLAYGVSARPDLAVDAGGLDCAIAASRALLLRQQDADGHWCHELEADCTMPAEYVLMLRYLGEYEPDVEAGMANYLRRHQGEDGGWALYPGSPMDISCSVKAYFALKLLGEDVESAHMRRARDAILAQGGAANANVFTRIALALFGQLPWRGVPVVPVEFALLPRWFPFEKWKVSYWSRCTMMPLAVLCTLKTQAANPDGVDVRELFVTPPEQERHYFKPPATLLGRVCLLSDRAAQWLGPYRPQWLLRLGLRRIERWLLPRLNGVDGLGAIFPPTVAAYEALLLMGYDRTRAPLTQIREAMRRLLVHNGDETYCQPCVSPVWDTGLSCLVMQEDDDVTPSPELERGVHQALDWLAGRQLIDVAGDWSINHKRLRGGGWAFQYRNDYYPDLDDTSVVAWAMHASRWAEDYAVAIRSAANWLVGMQSRNGAFAAFDANNDHTWLNQIPFADHGALLDPPTADVSARVLTLLSLLDRPGDARVRRQVLEYLRRSQTREGCWFGRWGTNYIYGTWSVLMALERAGVDASDAAVGRAVAWLKGRQREDGSWSESNDTYADPDLAGVGRHGNAAQTSWALLGLMAAGQVHDAAVTRGIHWLLRQQANDGRWYDSDFNAPGFPRVFYLKYHGYAHYFPYWALARYRRLTRA